MNTRTRYRFPLNGLWAMVMMLPIAFPPGRPTDAADLQDLRGRLREGQPTRIVCFGDSITGAYYHTGSQRAWCDLLGLSLQKTYPRASLQMINAGISGNTTANALARIDRDVLQQRPHLVVIMFGMNDVARLPAKTFDENLRTIVLRCREAKAQVVLCTPNSVVENAARPNARLAEFSTMVRSTARSLKVPVVDVFQDWQTMRKANPQAWQLMMSDAIHPNMNGHRRFAELMAATISGKPQDLADVVPPADALHHTFDRLQDGLPVKIVAMRPYDQIFSKSLLKRFPDAKIHPLEWPTENKTLAEMAAWGKGIRAMKPSLVIPAVPSRAGRPLAKHRNDYEWVLNWSFQFAGRPWDVVPVMSLNSSAASADRDIERQLLIGKDVRFVERLPNDDRSVDEIVEAWIDRQYRLWQGARGWLPEKNGWVTVPTQPWPYDPGPREVRTSLYFPGGQLKGVNAQTGIMLTLHNWGGTDCAGTADPQTLADRLNVVAVCVNYLQSGRRAVDDPRPYDFGCLQAIDALRALAYVETGLKKVPKPYAKGRVFCTGGSGGGNVTLMAHKFAPRTFACIIDMCGMKKLSDDIAFDLPGGSRLNARWSRDPKSPFYLTDDAQEIRFLGSPVHLKQASEMGMKTKVIVVHGTKDTICPFADAEEMVRNMRAASWDVESHFLRESDLDGRVFTSAGHALGNRTEIVFRVAGTYLRPDNPQSIKRTGPSDFERKEDVIYNTSHGRYVVSYSQGLPVIRFEPGVE